MTDKKGMSLIDSALEHWKSVVRLEDRKHDLDAQALQTVENEERSNKGRASLLEITKDFKKSSNEDKLKNFDGVLKAYQGEINKLIARAKFAEGAFLEVYKALAAAPDPVPLLQGASADAGKVASLEAELRDVKGKLVEYDKEFQNLKNQEYTVRKLEAENKEYERRLEARVAEVTLENKKTAADEIAEARRQFQEQEKLHAARLQSAKDALTRALQQHDKTQSQLLDAAAKAEHAQAAKDSEEQLVSAEIDRLNAMLAVAKRELADLQSQNRLLRSSAAAAAGGDGGAASSSSSLGLLELQEEVSQLRASLEASEDRARAAAADARDRDAAHERLVADLRQRNEHANAQITKLQEDMRALPSKHEYQTLRKQLSLLQEVEFNVVDLDGASSASPRSGSGGGGGADAKSPSSASLSASTSSADDAMARTPAEQLLVKKTRHLESEVTRLKLELADKSDESSRLQQQLGAVSAQAAAHAALIAQLEAQLLASTSSAAAGALAKPAAAAALAAGGGGGSGGSSLLPGSAVAGARGVDLASLLAVRTIDVPAPTDTKSSAAGASTTAATAAPLLPPAAGGGGAEIAVAGTPEHSMLAIVTAQRDRFKRQIEAMEREQSGLTAQVSALTAEVDTLKGENLRLFEKLRYVQRYKSEGGGGGGSSGTGKGAAMAASGGDDPSDLELGGAAGSASRRLTAVDSTERKYEKLYEDNVNPFKEFRKRQMEEQYKRLSMTEKITLSVGQFCFSKKHTRSLIFFYSLALHILVFVSLWTHTISPHCTHDHGLP